MRRRFAAFYMAADPEAPNYDPRHKIIRSMQNGSRGPMLRKPTPRDWVGDPFDVRGFDAELRESEDDCGRNRRAEELRMTDAQLRTGASTNGHSRGRRGLVRQAARASSSTVRIPTAFRP
jgi:hypothetical protein